MERRRHQTLYGSLIFIFFSLQTKPIVIIRRNYILKRDLRELFFFFFYCRGKRKYVVL